MLRLANPRTSAAGALVFLAVALYVQTLSFGFTLDDAHTILGHPGVQGSLSWTGIFLHDSWGRSRFDTIGIWRPLPTFTFWCAKQIAAGRAWPFHLVNVLLFAVFVALADRFLARWSPRLSDRGRWTALVTFLALAIHASVVPYLTGAADLLAALFSLIAVSAVTRPQGLAAADVIVGIVGLVGALGSKESSAPLAVLLPILAFRADRTGARGARAPRDALVALALWCGLVLAAVALFRATSMPFMSLGPERAMENPLLAVDTPHRLVGAVDVLGLYLKHMVTGAGLSPDYSFSEPPILRDGTGGVITGALFIAMAVGALVSGWKKMPRLADAVLAFGASYVATSNIFLGASAIGDRYFFLPSFWIIAGVAMVLDRAARSLAVRRLVCVASVLFATFQGRAAIAYASSFHDDVTLLTRSVRLYPNVYRAQRNLAHALADEGRDDEAAYHLVVAEAIHAHYPIPVARTLIQATWDDLPFAARLDRLREAFGDTPTCAAARLASARLRSWRPASASDDLDVWTRGACARE